MPRTPTYDDLHTHFNVENSPSGSSTVRQWSHGSDPSDLPSAHHRKKEYRKREDILHENGGTGGRYASARYLNL